MTGEKNVGAVDTQREGLNPKYDSKILMEMTAGVAGAIKKNAISGIQFRRHGVPSNAIHLHNMSKVKSHIHHLHPMGGSKTKCGCLKVGDEGTPNDELC